MFRFVLFCALSLLAVSYADRSNTINTNELVDFANCAEIINVANNLLDRLSDANSTAQEDALLAQLGALFTDDIVVVTDGRTFTGKAAVLAGQRFVHSTLQDHARRLGSSQILEEHTNNQVTLYQMQHHFYISTADGSFNEVVRDTRGTCVKRAGSWLVSYNALSTIYKNRQFVNGSGLF